jgi:hypothetical protein
VAVSPRRFSPIRLGLVGTVVRGQQHQRDLAAGLLFVAGVALVHLHKAGEQLAALGGIGGPGADGKVLGPTWISARPAARRLWYQPGC